MKDACPKCGGDKDTRSKVCKECRKLGGWKCKKHKPHGMHPNSIRRGPQTPEHIEKRCQSLGYRERDVRYPIHLNSQEKRAKQLWAKLVKARDQSCRMCGSGDRLHAHHILSHSKHPELSLILNNGVTLCHQCHWDEHRLNGTL